MPPNSAPSQTASAQTRRRKGLLRHLLRRAALALLLVTVFVLAVVFGPVLAPHPMTDADLTAARQGPSATNWLGTDPLGRDVFSRLLGAARVATQTFLIVVLIGGVLGTTLGLAAGGIGGVLGLVVSRLVEVLQGFPTILVAIVIVALLDPSLMTTMIAVGIAAIPDFARVARSVALQLRDREFVQAAKGLGASEPRILWSEILPNMLAPLMVIASFDGAQAVLWEASLSFPGLAAPSFGSMLRESQGYLSIQPGFALIVGLAVSGVTLGLNLMGDAITDWLEQRER